MKNKKINYFEKYYPFGVSLILVLLIYVFLKDLVVKINFPHFFDSVLILFSVLLGFLMTVSTLLHTVSNELMKYVKNAGLYKSLTSYLISSIKLSLFITFITLIIPTVTNYKINNDIVLCFKYGYLFFVAYGSLSAIRIINLFLKIITSND